MSRPVTCTRTNESGAKEHHCKRCDTWQPTDRFAPRKGANGFSSYCKACEKQYHRARRAKLKAATETPAP